MESDTYDVEFGYLDWEAEIDITERNLPHWFQAGAATHITLRTNDSLPRKVVERMTARLEEFLQARSLPADLAAGFWDRRSTSHDEITMRLTNAELKEFKSLARKLLHRSLDECHGACHLRDPKYAEIVANSIRHFDGKKYHLDRFVVMPNHAHILAQFEPGFGLDVVGQSWMRYTARLINQHLGIDGRFWSREPFDNVMRSPEQFFYTQNYIKRNPIRANLREGEYHYWQRP